MSLPDTNITTTLVGNEINLASRLVSALVGVPGLNEYSRYAPGQLDVDANKNITLTPPTGNFKLGDYRRYNKDAQPPTWWSPPASIKWGPGGATTNSTLLIAMNELNILAFPNNGVETGTNPAHYHARVDVYASAQNRIDQASCLLSAYPLDINMVAHTPLVGHTRQVNWVMNTGVSGNQFVVNNIPVTGPLCTRYFEAYFCDIAGNRLVNFGTTRAAGYIDLTYSQYQAPKIQSGQNFSPTPAQIGGVSWTFVAPMINDTLVPCGTNSPLTMQQGSGNFSFWVKAKGLVGSTMYIAGISSCDIHLMVTESNGSTFDQTIATGVEIVANSAGYQCDGPLTGGKTWQYDWVGKPELRNVVWSGTNFSCA